MSPAQFFARLALYILTHICRRITPLQLARMCCVDLVFASQVCEDLVEQGLLSKRLIKAQPPIKLFGDPVYRSPLHEDRLPRSAEYFEFVVAKIRNAAKPSQKHKPMVVLSATPMAVESVGGVLPEVSSDDPRVVERDLNVASMFGTGHWFALNVPRWVNVEAEAERLPIAPMRDPNYTPGPESSALIELPEPTFDPAPVPPASSRNTYELIFSFGKHGRLWLGKDALVFCGLSIGGFVPDLAVVVDGKIEHAAQLVIGCTTKELVDIDRECRTAGVTYELFAEELTGHNVK